MAYDPLLVPRCERPSHDILGKSHRFSQKRVVSRQAPFPQQYLDAPA
jgi:hypothetical protein